MRSVLFGSLAALSMAAFLASACGGVEDDQDDQQPEGVDDAAALAPPGPGPICHVYVDESSIIGSQANPSYPDPVRSTSAGDTYGGGFSNCYPGWYVVEATETLGYNLYLVGNYGDTYGAPHPLTQAACEATSATANFWGYDGTWHNLGTISDTGTWDLAAHHCNSPYGAKLINNSPYSRVRVLAKASQSGASKKVTAYIDNLQW